MSRHAHLLAVLALGLLMSACSAGLPQPGLPASVVAARLAQKAPGPRPTPLVLATRASRDGFELVAFDVERSSVRFRRAVERDASAELLGDVIWLHTARAFEALDARDGATLYRIAQTADPSARYTGAARTGDGIAWVDVQGTELDPAARATLHVVDARSGRERFVHSLNGHAGRPSAAGELVLVPSQRQRIVVIDAQSGAELARLRAQSDTVEWLELEQRALLFGGRAVHRLSAQDPQPAALFALPSTLEALPGRPRAPSSAYVSAVHSARRRVGLHVALAADGPTGAKLVADRAYFAFYSQLFGFDGRGQLVLARKLPSTALDVRVAEQGVWIATAAGELLLLSHSDGATLAATRIAEGLDSARLPAALEGSFVSPAPSGAALPAGTQGLRAALIELASDTDSRLVPSRALAVEQLARLPEPDITFDLLALYEGPNTPPELQRALADALTTRRTGMHHLVAALERRYDFLSESKPAPLTVIAPVLALAKERGALPGLLSRLVDHETPRTALSSLADAIAALAGAAPDPGIAARIVAFMRLYRADSSLRDEPKTFAALARAALAHGGAEASEELARAFQGQAASVPLIAAVASVIAPPARAAVPTAKPATATAAAPVAARPRLLEQAVVDAAFAARTEALKPCLQSALASDPKLGHVRIAFIAESDGGAHAFHFAPASRALAECLYPKVADIRVAPFEKARAVASVVLDVRAMLGEAAPALPSVSAADQAATWWAWRARAPRAVQGTPWWRSMQPVAPFVESEAALEAGSESTVPSVPSTSTSTTTTTNAPTTKAEGGATGAPKPAEPEVDRWWAPAAP
jgi:hypothetical protein